MLRKVIIGFFTLSIFGAIGIYLYEIIYNGALITDNLFKTLSIVFVSVSVILKSGVGRKPVEYYEEFYSAEIKNAFIDSFWDRKRLLCAARLYDEDNLQKAIKYLNELEPKCKSSDEIYAVGVFKALCFSDLGMNDSAIKEYNNLIYRGMASSIIYNNLGLIYYILSNKDEAVRCYNKSIDLDPKHHIAYYNLARVYFDEFDLINAEKYAKMAYDADNTYADAASLLAIIFYHNKDENQFYKFYHIAIANGEDADDLKYTMEMFDSSFEHEKDGSDMV